MTKRLLLLEHFGQHVRLWRLALILALMAINSGSGSEKDGGWDGNSVTGSCVRRSSPIVPIVPVVPIF
jgi:hypothetical protein